MGQVLHGGANTTHAVRKAVQRSKATIAELSRQHGVTVEDAPMGPKTVRSSVLSAEEEVLCVTFRKHTLLPLDDCLYALQATIPHAVRSTR